MSSYESQVVVHRVCFVLHGRWVVTVNDYTSMEDGAPLLSWSGWSRGVTQQCESWQSKLSTTSTSQGLAQKGTNGSWWFGLAGSEFKEDLRNRKGLQNMQSWAFDWDQNTYVQSEMPQGWTATGEDALFEETLGWSTLAVLFRFGLSSISSLTFPLRQAPLSSKKLPYFLWTGVLMMELLSLYLSKKIFVSPMFLKAVICWTEFRLGSSFPLAPSRVFNLPVFWRVSLLLRRSCQFQLPWLFWRNLTPFLWWILRMLKIPFAFGFQKIYYNAP
jgi:hypothetical protein